MLFQPRPITTFNNVLDRAPMNTELVSGNLLTLRTDKRSYFPHVRFGQLSQGALFSSGVRSVSHSVSEVFASGSPMEVRRVHTCSVVTRTVASIQSYLVFAGKQNQRDTVGGLKSTVIAKRPIPLRAQCKRPKDAVSTGAIALLRKPLKHRTSRLRLCKKRVAVGLEPHVVQVAKRFGIVGSIASFDATEYSWLRHSIAPYKQLMVRTADALPSSGCLHYSEAA